MDDQVKKTTRRIAKEIAQCEARQSNWNGVERRKHTRAEFRPRGDNGHTIIRDRRHLPSVFANLDLHEDDPDETEDPPPIR